MIKSVKQFQPYTHSFKHPLGKKSFLLVGSQDRYLGFLSMAWIDSYAHCGQKMWDHSWPSIPPSWVSSKNRELTGRTGPQWEKIKYFVLHLFGGDLVVPGYRDSGVQPSSVFLNNSTLVE